MKRIFSFPAMLAAGLVLVTFLSVRSRFNDPDTWWHLKVGQEVIENRSIPRTDQFSFTTNNHAWLPHEWLAEASLYLSYRAAGYMGVWLWSWFLSSMIVVAVYAVCCLYSGNAKVSLLGGLAGWLFGTVSLAARPLLIGYLFLALEILFLQLARTRDRRWFWALPALFAVWVNCHGSYLVGVMVLGIAVVCSFVDLRAGRLVSERREHRERMIVCTVFLLCIAALLVNPVGPKLLTYPIDLFTKQTQSLMSISEWRRLDVDDPRGIALFAIAGLIGLIFLVRSKAVYLEELLLLVLGFGMALRHVRLLFVFGIIVGPILSRLMADLWEGYDPKRDLRWANAAMIGVAVLIVALAFPKTAFLEEQIRATSPVKAVDFIRRTRLAGPMLNHYQWGGYLIWALPEQKVFIDGRGDVFDWTGVLTEFNRWSMLQEDPNRLLDKYGIRYCLLQKDASITRALPYLPGWKQIYSDELAVIFARDKSL